MSNYSRLFFPAVTLLVLGNLLLVNDWMTFWNGAESTLLLQLTESQSPTSFFLPLFFLSIFEKLFGFSEFSVRLPGGGLLLLTLAGLYFFGRKIFGQRDALFTLLVLGSSFLLVNMSKLASADIWLFAAQTGAALTLLLYLKQPTLTWQLWCLVLTTLAAFIQPWSSLVFTLGLWLYLYILHPQGKRLAKLYIWALWLLLLPVLYVTDSLHNWPAFFYIGYGANSYGNYLLLQFLAVLPWIGFFIAALWQMGQRARKREELAIITLGWLLVGLAAQSLAVQAIFSLLIAKQILGWQNKKYPYGNIVKTGALLHLILFFFIATLAMISGFLHFEGTGYRAALAVGAVYWIWSFVGVIGLFLNNWRTIVGGMALSGLLAVTFFWLQLYPIWENFRSLPRRIATEAYELSYNNANAAVLIASQKPNKKIQNLLLYANRRFERVTPSDATVPATNFSLIIADSISYQRHFSQDSTRRTEQLKGWMDGMNLETWYVVDAAQ